VSLDNNKILLELKDKNGKPLCRIWNLRLRLEAVGEDWNGTIRPISDLSYESQEKPA